VGYEGEGIDPDNNAYLRSLAAQRPWMSTVAHLPVAPAPTRPPGGTADRSNAYPHPEADPVVSVVLDAFGPSRCIWGSDFSPTLDHGTFEQAFNVPQLDQLSETEIDRVKGANLLQLLA